MATIAEPEKLTLGTSLPPGDPHGVSVHLPKWADTVGWASREPRVLDAMKTGYPRFFVARVVHQLAMRLLDIHHKREAGCAVDGEKTGAGAVGGQLATVLDTLRHARMCRRIMTEWNAARGGRGEVEIGVYVVKWDGDIVAAGERDAPETVNPSRRIGDEDIILVSYPEKLAADAKAFWQHTGYGISSRRATHWLEDAPFLSTSPVVDSLVSSAEISHRVGCARDELKRRIAAGQSTATLTVSPSDVFLFPTGMSTISEVMAAIKTLRQPTPDSPYRAAIFGFPYVDTYKLTDRIHHFHTTLYKPTTSSLTTLTQTLNSPHPPKPNSKIDALLTETPGNPLLQTPPLPTLHHLSQTHSIPLIVDDTIGTYAALHLLPYTDVLCTSLTKMFSGACNVMGGAATLNPRSPFYARLKAALERYRVEEEERAWFWGDVLVMEGNSRDFVERVNRASGNAEVVVGLLRRSWVVREVFYPLGGETQEGYDLLKREGGRYGYMLSVRFGEARRAVAFYDALDVAKGPSLGTNFTLCCAYTLLAHYKELEWAAEYGVVEDLVRISVGLEDRGWLEERVGRALRAAESV